MTYVDTGALKASVNPQTLGLREMALGVRNEVLGRQRRLFVSCDCCGACDIVYADGCEGMEAAEQAGLLPDGWVGDGTVHLCGECAADAGRHLRCRRSMTAADIGGEGA